jgi:hypothetical protein
VSQGLERDIELLEIQETSAWQQRLAAGVAGLVTAGPLGLVASLVVFNKVEGHWLPWALVGVLAAPPLALGQWRGVEWLQKSQTAGPVASATGKNQAATDSINEADRLARACALAVRQGNNGNAIRNPLDGSDLFCDRTYPTTVVITSRRFAPLEEPLSCGSSTLAPGTRAAQWLVSPAGTLVCEAIASSSFWWWEQAAINRQMLYRRCTENLRREARTGFSRTAHQLGLRDYCAEERALLARDRIRAQ